MNFINRYICMAVCLVLSGIAVEASESSSWWRFWQSRQKLVRAVDEETKALWDAFEPPPDPNYDWLQLDSGEWLKGDFKVLYDHTLEFDSDEMGVQDFDFVDVKKLRTRQNQRVLIQNPQGRGVSVESGLLNISGDKITLTNGDEKTELERNQVVSIASGGEDRRGLWSGRVSIGLNERKGNTETTDNSASIAFKRRAATSRFDAELTANYSENSGDKTADNQRVSTDYDWLLGRKFFWQVFAIEYFRDPFVNIDAQYSAGSGPGYDLIWSTKTEWSVYTGLGYIKTYFDSVEAGEETSSDSPFFYAGTSFEHELTSRIDILADYSMRALNDDNGRYTHNAKATLSVELIKDFDIDLSYVWDHIEKPEADADGKIPDKDDYQFIVSLAYEF